MVGYYLLPTRLTGDMYEVFLRLVLPELLDEMALCIQRQMWPTWLRSGAYLKECATISRPYFSKQMDKTLWLARSPDLILFDSYLWGHMKSLIYETLMESRIVDAARVIADNARVFTKHALTCRVDILNNYCESTSVIKLNS